MTVMVFLLLLAEFVALYVISRRATQGLYTLLLIIFRKRTIALPILLVIEFPGTVLHELAHLFTATALGVPTGKLRLEPESIRDEHVKSGSVSIMRTDPFRTYAIGLAPIVWGLIILSALSYIIPQVQNSYLLLVIGYLLFVISNTMFSSPSDLAGFVPFTLVLASFIVGLYLMGIRVQLTGPVLSGAVQVATTLTKSLALVIAINVGILAVTWLATTILMKLFRIRIL
jgi:hypothetical protein